MLEKEISLPDICGSKA